MEKFRIEPGSAARMAESEPRPVSRSIEPGSAAKAAEERARNAEESVQAGAYRGSVSVTLRAATGKKFEFPDRPQGPGEALPRDAVEKPAHVELPSPQQTSSFDASTQEAPPKAPGIFRRLFRR